MTRRRFRIPPPPRGLPRQLKVAYLLIAAVVAAIVSSIPQCPLHDAQGRPLWRVRTVHDGDTVTCTDEKGQLQKIRLVGIDAPEFDQPHGRTARAALETKLAGGGVRVVDRGRDQHGRLLGTLFLDASSDGSTTTRVGRNINREMVLEGHAWVFGGFSPDPDLVAAEEEAKKSRRGLWADPRAIPPSRWRDTHPPHQRVPGRTPLP